MRLACSFPLCLLREVTGSRTSSEAQFKNLPTLALVPRKGRPLKPGSRRRGMGTLNRRKIPDSCKPRIILPLGRGWIIENSTVETDSANSGL